MKRSGSLPPPGSSEKKDFVDFLSQYSRKVNEIKVLECADRQISSSSERLIYSGFFWYTRSPFDFSRPNDTLDLQSSWIYSNTADNGPSKAAPARGPTTRACCRRGSPSAGRRRGRAAASSRKAPSTPASRKRKRGCLFVYRTNIDVYRTNIVCSSNASFKHSSSASRAVQDTRYSTFLFTEKC